MPANLPLLELSAALLACAILLGLWGSRLDRTRALHYLAPGSACFVTGVPTLEPLPPKLAEGEGGAYRAGVERVPVFRARAGRLVISDRAEETRRHETRIRARFDLFAGTLVALLALALAALHALQHWKLLPRG